MNSWMHNCSLYKSIIALVCHLYHKWRYLWHFYDIWMHFMPYKLSRNSRTVPFRIWWNGLVFSDGTTLWIPDYSHEDLRWSCFYPWSSHLSKNMADYGRFFGNYLFIKISVWYIFNSLKMNLLKLFLIFKLSLCSYRLGRIHTLHLYDPAIFFKRPSVAHLSWKSNVQPNVHKDVMKLPEENRNDQILLADTNIVESENLPSWSQSMGKHLSIQNSFFELAKILDNVKQHIMNDRPLNALWLLQKVKKLNGILLLNFRYHSTAFNKNLSHSCNIFSLSSYK